MIAEVQVDANSKAVAASDPNEQAHAAWLEHRRKAVCEFLKNVVVIDNEPVIGSIPEITEELFVEPEPAYETEVDESDIHPKNAALKEQVSEPREDRSHVLDVQVVSDAFSERGIACAFVLPTDGKGEAAQITARILSAARFADLLVIDWHLRDNNPALTLRALKEIAEADAKERGRMRLICIYTGQGLEAMYEAKGILQGSVEALSQGGVELKIANDGRSARSANNLLLLLSKGECKPEELPDILIDAFANLADGLLPSFALAAVGAIRKNVHHMITQFSSDMDSAYVANRMITDPPGDVAELIRELFVAECDNALGLERIADCYLDVQQIKNWMDVRNMPLSTQTLPYKDSIGNSCTAKIDRHKLDSLLDFGVTEDHMILDENETKLSFHNSRRQIISSALCRNKDEALNSERRFARLVGLRREAFGSTKIHVDNSWRPSLTTGTLLKILDAEKSTSKYLMCVTPACDSLRLSKESRFVFIGDVSHKDKANLVLTDEAGSIVKIHFPHERPVVMTITFSPDLKTEKVMAVREEVDGQVRFVFSSVDVESKKFLWLGEVRYGRATSDVAKVASHWMRIGVNDSEYLRLAARGYAKL